MAYMDYKPSLYRTGFRPYGQTNAWAASQLNGMDTSEAVLSGYLGQSHPFMPSGGWGLHGSASFHPWVLEGMGDTPVCLDQAQNAVNCQDPECTYGDCGAAGGPPVSTGGCLDQKENQVLCMDPNCTYGDCLSAPAKSSMPANIPQWISSLKPVTLPPGPSPRVSVPVTPAFAQTSIIKGVPDLLLYAFAGIAALSFIGGGRRR
jgi:hypothetical protein